MHQRGIAACGTVIYITVLVYMNKFSWTGYSQMGLEANQHPTLTEIMSKRLMDVFTIPRAR